MRKSTLAELRHVLRPLANRIANSIARAVVDLVDDSTDAQQLQLVVLDGEVVADAERFQNYGFTSVPIEGAEAVVLFPNGDRAHPLVVAVDDKRLRPVNLQKSEVALYSQNGQRVLLKADGSVEITGTEIRLATDDAADPVIRKSDLDAFIDDYNLHVHVTPSGNSDAPTTSASKPPGSDKVKAPA